MQSLDVLQYVTDLTTFGKVAQLRAQILLQRLVVLRSLLLESGMDIVGKVTD